MISTQSKHSDARGKHKKSSIKRLDIVPKRQLKLIAVAPVALLRSLKLFKFGFRSKTFYLGPAAHGKVDDGTVVSSFQYRSRVFILVSPSSIPPGYEMTCLGKSPSKWRPRIGLSGVIPVSQFGNLLDIRVISGVRRKV